MPVRSYAKEAAPSGLPPLKGDGSILILSYFLYGPGINEVMGFSYFEKNTRVATKNTVSLSEKKIMFLQFNDSTFIFLTCVILSLKSEAKRTLFKDAHSMLKKDQNNKELSGLTDDLGAETMMMEALEKVEKEIKKPLLRSDKKNMAVLLAEFDKINQKLGIRKEDLPKYEEELELKIAKEDLQGLKKERFGSNGNPP
ncbi:unnamed protein product [Musa acuminata var. zebrina]